MMKSMTDIFLQIDERESEKKGMQHVYVEIQLIPELN
jgi:hypothetical protein